MFLALVTMASAGVLPVDVQTEHLDNGLTVYLAPMDTPGVVSWQVWMDVGTRNETSNSRGLGHLHMYLASAGSRSLDRDAREAQVLLTGATDTALAYDDYTVYEMGVPAEHLPSIIMIEANRLMYMNYDASDLEQTAGAVKGAHNRNQASTERTLSEAFDATAYAVHPYGHPMMGSADDIDSFDDRQDEIVSWYKTWYRPEQARIIVVGDFDPQAILTQLNLTFGVWEPGVNFPDAVEEPEQTSTRRVAVDWDKGPANPKLQMGWRVPGFDPRDPDAATLAVVKELFQSEIGPLHQDLVVERALVYGVGTELDEVTDMRHFIVTADVKHPDDLGLVEEAVNAAVADLVEGIDTETLELLRDSALARFRLSLDTPSAVGETIGVFTYGGRDASAVEAFYRNFANVTAEDVSRVVSEYFVAEHLTVATLSTAAAEEE